MTRRPHSILGVAPGASAEEIRTARRELARVYHPDAGGSAELMQEVNAAAAEALRLLSSHAASSPTTSNPTTSSPVANSGDAAGGSSDRDPGSAGSAPHDWVGSASDVPSFTIESLPAAAFEALLIVTAELGEVVDDDPPYELRTVLAPPLACWCQLDVVPDAGASTVNVSIAALDDHELPLLFDVRNAFIDSLNALDWTALD